MAKGGVVFMENLDESLIRMIFTILNFVFNVTVNGKKFLKFFSKKKRK